MFGLFVIDLLQAVMCSSINIYADDITLYTAASTLEPIIETHSADAQSTLEWYRQNRLVVNLKKDTLHGPQQEAKEGHL